jgi:hypothetical protein
MRVAVAVAQIIHVQAMADKVVVVTAQAITTVMYQHLAAQTLVAAEAVAGILVITHLVHQVVPVLQSSKCLTHKIRLQSSLTQPHGMCQQEFHQ